MANRISLSVYISRDDVYSRVVLPAKENRELNKLISSLLNAYADFPQVRDLIDGRVATGDKIQETELNSLLSGIEATMAKSDFLMSEAQFSTQSFQERVEDGIEGDVLPEEVSNSDFSDLREEIEEGNKITHSLLREVVDALRGSRGNSQPLPVLEQAPQETPIVEKVVEDVVEDVVEVAESQEATVEETASVPEERKTDGIVQDTLDEQEQVFADIDDLEDDPDSDSVLTSLLSGL